VAFFFTDVMPLSQLDSDSYISLLPINLAITCLQVKVKLAVLGNLGLKSLRIGSILHDRLDSVHAGRL
jgi:hypothetical protein